MPVNLKKNTLSGIQVNEVVRKQVICLHHEQPLSDAIQLMSKHKLNSVLVADDDLHPTGVVSKTDIMGAYYASLPIDSPLNYIMNCPPIFCRKEDLLENALDEMRSNKINSLYVEGEIPGQTAGILSYADIVGLLYHYCHNCKLSKRFQTVCDDNVTSTTRYRASEVMDSSPISLSEDESLSSIMEALSGNRHGGVLLLNNEGNPSGIVSKSDLVRAFNNGIPADVSAKAIMSTQLVSCEENDYLETAIQKMITSEVQSLFVFKENQENITGILTLADTARVRSGSCHACLTSRTRVEKHH